MRNPTLLVAMITLIALSCSYEHVHAQAYSFANSGYSSHAATPLSSQDAPMFGVTTSQASQTCSSDNAGVSDDFVIRGEVGLKGTLTDADLGNLLNGMILPSSQPKHTCVSAKDATPSQRTGFDECRANLPDCDKMRWDVSGEGHRILTCKCYRIFSSC